MLFCFYDIFGIKFNADRYGVAFVKDALNVSQSKWSFASTPLAYNDNLEINSALAFRGIEAHIII